MECGRVKLVIMLQTFLNQLLSAIIDRFYHQYWSRPVCTSIHYDSTLSGQAQYCWLWQVLAVSLHWNYVYCEMDLLNHLSIAQQQITDLPQELVIVHIHAVCNAGYAPGS